MYTLMSHSIARWRTVHGTRLALVASSLWHANFLVITRRLFVDGCGCWLAASCPETQSGGGGC